MLTYEDMLLVQLAEECNEVAQRAAKCLRFGMDDVQAGVQANGEPWPTNRTRLMNEINDVLSLIDMCAEVGIVDGRTARDALKNKRKRVYRYMDLSIKLGRMSPKVPYYRTVFDDIPHVESVQCVHPLWNSYLIENGTFELRACSACGVKERRSFFGKQAGQWKPLV